MDYQLTGQSRKSKGKAFRRENTEMIPGVVYGKTTNSTPIAVDRVKFEKLYGTAGTSSIFDLNIEGSKKPLKVLVQDVDFDPRSGFINHFDLYAVTLGEKLQTDIPLHFEGESSAKAAADMMVSTIKDTVEVSANPLDLPESIVVNIENLSEIGDAIYVKDLKVDTAKVEILDDPEEIVVKVDAVVEEEEPEPEESELLEGDDAEGEQDESGDDLSDSSESSEESSEDKA